MLQTSNTPSRHTNNNIITTTSIVSIPDNTELAATFARQMSIQPDQVTAFIQLYDEGATIPFIARYRQDNTRGLDATQLRQLEAALLEARDLQARRKKIADLLISQNKLTESLEKKIQQADSRTALSDIYLPFKQRKLTLVKAAINAGLAPIAQQLLQQLDDDSTANQTPEQLLAAAYNPPQQPRDATESDTDELSQDDSPKATTEVANLPNKPKTIQDYTFTTLQEQLDGLQALIIDAWTEDLDLLSKLTRQYYQTAQIHTLLADEEKRTVGKNFQDYFDHKEPLNTLPDHRLLAMLRGRQENVLTIKVINEDEPFIALIADELELNTVTPEATKEFLLNTAKKLWKDKYKPHLSHRMLTEKRLKAQANAIDVFANNLHHVLMAAPAGNKVILGVDPGIRHGVKMAVINEQGQVIDKDGDAVATSIFPFEPDNQVEAAKQTLVDLLTTYDVDLIALGNGTASRQTQDLLESVLADNRDVKAKIVLVNEAGASVYSASELAIAELSELNVALRGAVSIARRLQDPLSELVKVDPKAIGVGQYQHDVNQNELVDRLAKVTQDCVNAVGVDVNTASPAILTYVAGLNSNVAQQIVTYRDEHGSFSNREQLKEVPRLGVKTFDQAAGFLRIYQGQNPLDATAIHPEQYPIVTQWLAANDTSITDIIGNKEQLESLPTQMLTEQGVGQQTQTQILSELSRPAQDPRPMFKTANFKEDINSIDDIEVGMTLEGVVTNVTDFGCFVDTGIHQDGLVHISEMKNGFVNDPFNLVKPGQVVTVRVIGVDTQRKRISYSLKPYTDTATSHNDNSSDANKGSANKKSHDKASISRRQKRPQRRKAATPSHPAKSTGNPKSKPAPTKQRKAATEKLGTLGALLQQAGVKKSGS